MTGPCVKAITWSTWTPSPVGQRCLLGLQPPSCSPGCLWKKYPTVASSWDRPLSGCCGVPGVGLAPLSKPCRCGPPGFCPAPPTAAKGTPLWTLTPPDSGAPFACSIPPLVSCQATSFIPRMLHGMLIPRESLNLKIKNAVNEWMDKNIYLGNSEDIIWSHSKRHG